MVEIATFYHQIICGVTEKGLSPDEAMKQVRAHGITKVDVNSDYLTEEEPEKFAERLRKNGLGIISVHGIVPCDVRDEKSFRNSVDEMKRRIILAKRAGSEFFMAVPCKAESFVEEDYDNYEAGVWRLLEEITPFGADNGIQITIENFSKRDFPYTSYDGIQKILRKVPGIRYTYDSGNFVLSGFNEFTGIKIFFEKTVYAHLKELKAVDYETPYLWDDVYYSKPPFGDGIVKNFEAVEYMIKRGYGGAFAVELYDSENVFEKTLISADRLKERIENIYLKEHLK